MTDMFVASPGDWGAQAIDTIMASDGVLAAGIRAYNSVFLAVGSMLLLYLITHTIIATAHHGKVMGRHSEVWFPIRFLVAIGLLVPLPPNGFNAGEQVVFGAMRMGLVAGSYVWSAVVDAASAGRPLIQPPPPATDQLAAKLFAVEFCTAMQNQTVRTSLSAPITETLVSNPQGETWSYDGDPNAQGVPGQCGTITVVGAGVNAAAAGIFQAHADAVRELQGRIRPLAQAMAARLLPPFTEVSPPTLDIAAAEAEYDDRISSAVADAIKNEKNNLDSFKQAATDGGWVKAGAWAINLLRINSIFADAADAVPTVSLPRYEWWGGYVYATQRAALLSADKWWAVTYGQNAASPYNGAEKTSKTWEVTSVLDPAQYRQMYDTLLMSGDDNLLGALTALGHEIVTTVWSQFSNFANERGSVEAVSDLQKLSASGSSSGTVRGGMVDGALAVMGATSSGLLGKMKAFEPAILGLLFSLLTGGIMLAYVLPMWPALLWLFAVARYFMTGMITALGAPIWAIAHLELDGEGIGGRAGPGYLALFEICTRPVVMVMALVGGMAVMILLGKLFSMVYFEAVRNSFTGNLGGFTALVVFTVMGAGACVTLVHISMWGIGAGTDTLYALIGSRLGGGGEAQRDTETTGGNARSVGSALSGNAPEIIRGLQGRGREGHTEVPQPSAVGNENDSAARDKAVR